MTTRTVLGLQIEPLPVRRIDVIEPSRWMLAAWRDFAAAPALSLVQGGTFVLFGYLIMLGLHELGLGSLVPAAVAAFFLVAPLLAVGFYDVSRRLEQGETPTLGTSLRAFRHNFPGLAGMGMLLMLCVAAWAQTALLIFMLFFHSNPPGLDNFIYNVLASDAALPFLVVGTLAGAVIASVVFAISAVSLPMLLDRDVSVMTAIATSCAAVRENWKVMTGWAATIVLLVGVGLSCLLIGLAVALPLVAYGTWHAYRATVA